MKFKNITLQFLGHSGFLITNSLGKKIAIDPYNISENIQKADLILITHNHYDHCSIKDIEKLSKEGTIILIPADAQSKIMKVKNIEMQIIEIGDKLIFGNIKVEAVPAYNINKNFHPKKEGWMGFIIKLGNVIIYHAGDTDKIPEMKKLTGYGKHENKFITLLPVSGKFVMDSEEAAEVVSVLKPTLAIPMHYGSGIAGTLRDAENFQQLCQEIGIKTQILEKE